MLEAVVGEVSDYPKMLKKLSVWAFINVTTITAILAAYIPWVKAFAQFFPVQLLGVPLLAALPGLVAAILSQLPLHDRISDLLKIRHRFDVAHILLPLARGVGIATPPDFENFVGANRKKLVYQVFYRYATSKGGGCVDQHLISMALTSWSWYWMCLEAIVYLSIAVIIAVVGGEIPLAAAFAAAIAIGLLLMWPAYARSRRYAAREVEEILGAPERQTDIRSSFNALQGPGQSGSQ